MQTIIYKDWKNLEESQAEIRRISTMSSSPSFRLCLRGGLGWWLGSLGNQKVQQLIYNNVIDHKN
jgi:hypothetical protein